MGSEQTTTAGAVARRHLAPLTSLRFFAAAAIIVFHMAGRWGMPLYRQVPFNIGVDLFFILSGFILAYNYRSMPSIGAAFKLVAYRIARIWPLHIVTMLAVVLLLFEPGNLYQDPSKAWASVLLMQAWLGNYVYTFSFNSVSWTLSAELAFYLVFPFLVMLSSRMVLLVAAMVTLAVIVWANVYWGPSALTDDFTTGAAIIGMHPGAYFILFVAGMLAARAFVKRDWSWMSVSAATVLEVLAVALAVFYFFYNPRLFWPLMKYWPLDMASFFWFKIARGVFFFLPLVFMLAIGRGLISRLLCNRQLVFLGEISFATYMCHQIVQNMLIKYGFSGVSAILLDVSLVYILSVALYFGVERPGQRILRRGIDEVWRRREDRWRAEKTGAARED